MTSRRRLNGRGRSTRPTTATAPTSGSPARRPAPAEVRLRPRPARRCRRSGLALQQAAARARGPDSHPTVESYMTGWLDDVVAPGPRAQRRAGNYEMFSGSTSPPTSGRRRLDRLTVRDVQTWVNQLRTRCQCCAQGKDAARASPVLRHRASAASSSPRSGRSTRRGRCCAARSAQAMRDELVHRNVAALVRMPVPRSDRPAIWTVDEARRFLESARPTATRSMPATSCCSSSACVAASCSASRGTTSTSTRARPASPGSCSASTASWSGARTKTRTSDAVLPAARHLRRRAASTRRELEQRWRPAAGEAWHGLRARLHHRSATPIDPRNFHRVFKERAAKAGVPVIPVHSTRRTCASLLVALDVHPRVAMADPPAQPDRGDDGHLLPGLVGQHPAALAQARQAASAEASTVTRIAVLRCCTGTTEALSRDRKGPLTWVEPRGLEPLTPCLQSRCATNCAMAPGG